MESNQPSLFLEQSDDELVLSAHKGILLAMSALLERYLPMVKAKVYHFYNTTKHQIDLDDLTQEALLALYRAIQSYCPEKEASFKTYAAVCMDNRLIDVLRKEKRTSEQPIALLSNEEMQHFLLLNTSTGYVPSVEELYEQQGKLDKYLHTTKKLLSSFEQQVLTFFLQDYSYQQIADQLQVPTKAVDNALQRIRRKLAKKG